MATEQGYIAFFGPDLLTENPIEGDGLIIDARINGLPIVYLNGLNVVDFKFTNSDSAIALDPFHKVKIGATILESATNLKTFLETKGYLSASFPISYLVLSNESGVQGVKSLYGVSSNILFDSIAYSDNIVFNSFNFNPTPTNAAKYFFQYKNIANDTWKCEIYEKDFTGTTTEIIGRATIQKSSSENHFTSIRGTGVSLLLEANEFLDFSDLYSKGETDFSVKLYRDNILQFQGFIKPDGIFQSYSEDIWNINVECVDGLGLLEGLSFNSTSGVAFSGKMSALDIIYNCLRRTGLELRIKTSIDILYYGIPFNTVETDVLAKMYVDVNRYIKSDDNTTMGCLEVLKSILELFNAVITQEYGEWYIYRPSDFYDTYYPVFKTYEIDKTYLGFNQYNLTRAIGSQVDNFYPHHCNSNQKIEIKGATSSFRLGYKYGFVNSILQNGNLKHEAGSNVYEGWTKNPSWVQSIRTGFLSIDPNSTIGISYLTPTPTVEFPGQKVITYSSNQSDLLEAGYTFDFKTRFVSYGSVAEVIYQVNLTPDDGSADYGLLADGTWSLISTGFRLRNYDEPINLGDISADSKFERSFVISANPLPKDGVITVIIQNPTSVPNGKIVSIKSVEVINTFAGDNVVGEFHTVNRIIPISSIVKDNGSVNNGDNSNKVYQGAIYKENQEDLTDFWYRRKFTSSEVKPLLRISAEDELRIAQKPMKLFSGDIFGYNSYISVCSINKISGKFMPIDWKYDTYSNISSLKLLELYSPELNDIEYIKTLDYGQTVKPTIIG
jgi:hypothetical protein